VDAALDVSPGELGSEGGAEDGGVLAEPPSAACWRLRGACSRWWESLHVLDDHQPP
jgi:hypothetical protein